MVKGTIKMILHKVIGLWVDASSLTPSVSLEIDGSIIKDVCQLCHVKNVHFISLAELSSTIYVVNLTITLWVTLLPLI